MRLKFLKDELVNRAVSLRTIYAFWQALDVQAANADLHAVLRTFTDEHQNKPS